MKKHVVFLFLVVCATGSLSAQNVLPGYDGYWNGKGKINVIDLIKFYPDRLPFIRNEIYARYGRPFTSKVYQNYFRVCRWYREKPRFTEDWLTQADKENAELIRSVEQTPQNFEATVSTVLKNIEYRGGQAVLTFTSRQELVWTDPDVDFGSYGISRYNAEPLPWFVMGDWILVYDYNSYHNRFEIAAYKLDHGTKKILSTVKGTVYFDDADALGKLLSAQGRPLDR